MGPKSDSGVPHAQEAKHLQQQPLRLARHTRTCERTGGIEVAHPAVKSGEQRVGRGLVGGEGEAVLSVGLEVGDGESAPARRCLPGGLYRLAVTGPLRGPPVIRALPVGEVVGSPQGGLAGFGTATLDQGSRRRTDTFV